MKGHRMSASTRIRPALLLAAIAVATSAAWAQGTPPPPASPSTHEASSEISNRLFLSFFQQAALVPSQWWEGQLEYDDGSKDIPVDVFLARGVVAFHPVKTLEVGGRVGFGTTDAPPGFDDGSGATDLEAYGKWVFPNVMENTSFAVGMVATVPTGDDAVGLGFNAFSTEAFGSVAHTFGDVIVGGNLGVRLNGDGDFQGVPLTGKTSFKFEASAIFPLANRVSLVAEALFETDRFEEINSTTEILAGINWRAFSRGIFRAGVDAGLSDGSPDFRVILGYAYAF
jgi:hypothetical protein